MPDPQPDFNDIYNRASAFADADFEREFAEATTDNNNIPPIEPNAENIDSQETT